MYFFLSVWSFGWLKSGMDLYMAGIVFNHILVEFVGHNLTLMEFLTITRVYSNYVSSDGEYLSSIFLSIWSFGWLKCGMSLYFTGIVIFITITTQDTLLSRNKHNIDRSVTTTVH